MPLYFFNIREGDELILDPDGSWLPDEATARIEAVTAARSLLATAVLSGRLPLDHAIEVTEAGLTVIAVTYAESVGVAADRGSRL